MTSSWLSDTAAVLALLLTPVFLLITGAFLWATSAAYTRETDIRLDRSPNDVTSLELFRLVVLLLSKTLIPGYAPKLSKGSEADTFRLPQLKVSGKLGLPPLHVATFEKAMTVKGSDTHMNPFFLFAQVNPLVVLILAHPACPIKPLGSVNTRNEFIFIEPATCCDVKKLTTAARAGELMYVASFREEGIRRKRGIEFSIRITLTIDDRDILILDMWFMQFLAESFMPPSNRAQLATTSERGLDLLQNDERDTLIQLKTSDPKLWANSCKDYNPIHISPTGARLFGFKGVIAHGNHVVALAVQHQVAKHTSLLHRCFSQDNAQVKLTMQFLRPMTLPLQASPVWASSGADLDEFVICGRNDVEHIRGKVIRSPATLA